MRRLLVGVVLLCALRLAGADEQTDTEARAAYDRGQTFYALGKFPEAIEQYKKAYQLSKRPSLLFNIAQGLRLSGDPVQAKFFYESYLRDVPDAANRAEVEKRIQEMEAAIAKQNRDRDEAARRAEAERLVAEREQHTKARSRTMTIAGLSVAGAGLATIGVGVFFGLKASGYAQDVDDAEGMWTEALEQTEKDGQRAATISYVMYGVGGALLIGGGTLFILGRLRPRAESHATIFAPLLGPDRAGVLVQGSF